MKTHNLTENLPAAPTPGPWRRNGSLITAQGDMQTTVASLPCGEDNITRFPDAAAKTFAARDANARLIAAAPDLLATLREITTHLTAQANGYLAPELWEHTRERLAAMGQAAIARAEGKA